MRLAWIAVALSLLSACALAPADESEACDPFEASEPTGDVVLEYAAELDDGRILVVTRPEEDWDYADFRLFLGDLDAVVERSVADVIRLLDGGTTTIDFDLDGELATAHFAVVHTRDGFDDGEWTLTIAGTVDTLTPLDDAPNDARYECLDP